MDVGRRVVATVVVPVYNDEEGLARCLRALESQTLPQGQFEVIVVDNGSDRLPRVQCPANGRIVTETAPGSYAARNTGIGEACASIIAFTDADCVPQPDWLSLGIDFLNRHSDVSSIGGRIEVFPRNSEHRTPVELHELIEAFHQDDFVANGQFAATANLFVRSTVFNEVGPFDTELRSNGDVEFGNRSINAGHRMEYVRSVVVRHPARRTFRSFFKMQFRTMAGTRDLVSSRGRSLLYQPIDTLRDVVPPIPSVARALSEAAFDSPIDRAKYAYAVFVIHYARAVFRFRLAFGARSPR